MGDVIRKDANPADIFEDVKTTYIRAKARKGIWEARAEEKLGSVVNLINLIEKQTTEAQDIYAPYGASIEAVDDRADDFLEGIADEVLNLIGRPDNDAIFAVLFPQQKAVYYTKGDHWEQPARMELLARLLELGLHPRLDPTRAQEIASQVRTMAAEYQSVLDDAREHYTRLTLLLKTRTALAQVAQISLVNLKRNYKAEGFSEAEIHSVIPDRPRPRKPSTPPNPPKS